MKVHRPEARAGRATLARATSSGWRDHGTRERVSWPSATRAATPNSSQPGHKLMATASSSSPWSNSSRFQTSLANRRTTKGYARQGGSCQAIRTDCEKAICSALRYNL